MSVLSVDTILIDGAFQIYNLKSPQLWVLNDLCSLLFLSTFAALILFWAEIIHQGVYHEPARYMRVGFITINVLVYILNIALMVFMVIVGTAISDDYAHGRPKDLAKLATFHLIESIDNYFFCALYSITCLAFLYYGIKLYTLLRGQNHINSPGRRAKLQEVAVVTSVCSLAFLLRVAMLILVFMPNWKPLNIIVDWRIILGYYAGAEVCPALLVLYILRKLPPSYNASSLTTRNANSRGVPSTYTSVSKPIIN